MDKDIVLYIGDRMSGTRQLGIYLEDLGLELCKVTSTSAAMQLMEKQTFALILIQFENVGRHIFDFYCFIRRESPKTIVMIVMTETRPRIEGRLFSFGVDDVAAGKQL